MKLSKIPNLWNEGTFSGNGQMGHLLYCRSPQVFEGTLDHHMLWETRSPGSADVPPSRFREQVEYWNKHKTLPIDLYDSPDQLPYRCKLPALSFRLNLPQGIYDFIAELDMQAAMWDIDFTLNDGRQFSGYSRLNSCVNVLTYCWNHNQGCEFPQVELIGWDRTLAGLEMLSRWDMPLSKQISAGPVQHLIQPLGDGRFTILTCLTRNMQTGTRWDMTLAIGDDASVICAKNEKLLADYNAREDYWVARHLEDWQKFWVASNVELPDITLQEAYQAEEYKMYCNMRDEGTPVVLQGVFNHADGFPAWYGDLHNDLNVQACYWAAHRSNRSELAYPYARTYMAAIDRFRHRAEAFFEVDGISIPTCMDLQGRGAGTEYSFWNTLLGGEIFVAVDMCWIFDYTQDEQLLQSCIFPLVSGCVELYRNIARQGTDGRLHIPHTISPEVPYENAVGLLFNPDSTFVIESLKYLCERLNEFERLLNNPKNAADKWKEFARQLPERAIGKIGLQLFNGVDLHLSHRHFCHLFPIFPLNELCSDNVSDKDLMERSLQHIRRLGYAEFMPFSFLHLSIFSSRMGWVNMAKEMLDLYVRCFRSPNTFAVNGDAYNYGLLPNGNQAGCSPMVFTLETGLMVITAVAEMLTHCAGGILFVFPAIPHEWKNAAFENLAVEGGHKVSAWRADGINTLVKIKVGRTGELQIDTKFLEDGVWRAWCLSEGHRRILGLENVGKILQLKVEANDVIEFERNV